MAVAGDGIVPGTTIVSVVGNQVTLSQAITKANPTFITAANVLTFAGSTPTIMLRANTGFNAAANAALNVAMAGSTGLTIKFDTTGPASPTGGILTLGFLGGGVSDTFHNALTGGITVDDQATLRAALGSQSQNPLGTNMVTLLSGGRLDVLGQTTTVAGLSARIFDTVNPTTKLALNLTDSSRVDFTGTATGVNFYLNTVGALGSNVLTTATVADLRVNNTVAGLNVAPGTKIVGLSSGITNLGTLALVGTNLLTVNNTSDFVLGQAVTGIGPEVAKCEAPMQMRKGRCVPPKEPEVAKCEHGDVYRKGKGCVPPDHGPETASCDRPFVKVGNGCACPPGLIQHGHDCRPPTIVVVPPPCGACRTWPGRTAANGSGCNSASATSAAATGLAGPAEEPSTDPVAGENRAGRKPLPAGRPLRPVGADLRQASGAQPLSLGVPAEASLLHAGRA